MNLKRSQFKRPVYERQPRSPVHPITDQRGTYGTAGLTAAPKDTIHRSEAYRRYVAAQECFSCRLGGFSQCAHENVGKGMSMKVCDSRAWPACGPHHGLIGCHQQFDLGLDGLTRSERREMGALYVAQMQTRAAADGWRFSKEGITRV